MTDEERSAAGEALAQDDRARRCSRHLVFVRQGDGFVGGSENGALVVLPVRSRQRRGVEALYAVGAANGLPIPVIELLGVDSPEAARVALKRAADVIGRHSPDLGRALAEGVHVGKEGARFELDKFSDSADSIRFA